MVISFALTIALLLLCFFFVKGDKYKRLILKIAAITTVILHYSSLYVDFFKTGSASIESPMILPIYPCNVMMWLLVICAFMKSYDSKLARIILEFTFYAGVFCGILGIVFNEVYDNNPTLTNWNSLKGLLSHSTMIFGCAYLLFAKYIKIRVFNCISAFCGLCLFLVDGLIINGLYAIFKLDPVNSMYLLEPPYSKLPWINTYLIGVFALLLVFAITAIYEQIALKKEDRWYSLLKDKINQRKLKKIKNERIFNKNIWDNRTRC